MKLVFDPAGSVAYADHRPGEAVDVDGILARARERTGVEYVELYEVDPSTPGTLGQRFLCTYRVRDGVRIKP